MADIRPSRLNRTQRKALARGPQSVDPGLTVVHPNAAGIDVNHGVHYVAVRPDRDPHPVRRFDCFTADVHRLADWLEHCGVTSVALQSTSVYWLPLYDIVTEPCHYPGKFAKGDDWRSSMQRTGLKTNRVGLRRPTNGTSHRSADTV